MRITLAAIALCACAPQAIEAGPAPVKGVSVQVWRGEVGDPNYPSAAIFLRNDADHPIVITDVQIFDCINIRQQCKTYRPATQVAPGRSIIVLQLDRIRPSEIQNFGYLYHTKDLPARQP